VKLRPLGERVTVRLEPEDPKVSAGGIQLLDRPQSFRKGTVLQVGPGCDIPTNVEGKTTRYSTQVRKGERVVFSECVFHTKQGKKLRQLLDGEEAIINERDILFVIEEGDPRVE